MAGELLKELEEDIHREEWLEFWRNYGPLIAGLVILTLIATGGYLWWRSSVQAQLEKESQQYEEALSFLNARGPNPQAHKIFEELAAKSESGYGLLSRLQLFRLHALQKKGNPQEFEKVVKHGEELLRVARKDRNLGIEGAVVLSLAYLELDTAKVMKLDQQTISSTLAHYEMPQNPWKGLALEAQGLSLLRADDEKAGDFYRRLLTAPEVTQSVRVRGSMEAIAHCFSLPPRPES